MEFIWVYFSCYVNFASTYGTGITIKPAKNIPIPLFKDRLLEHGQPPCFTSGENTTKGPQPCLPIRQADKWETMQNTTEKHRTTSVFHRTAKLILQGILCGYL